jgi:hypothetical protein
MGKDAKIWTFKAIPLKEYMDYNTYEKDKSGCHTDINL